MAESHGPGSGATQAAERLREAPGAYDREISYKGLRIFAVGLATLILASAFLMWAFSDYLRDRLVEADPPPPALPEARRPHTPPGPRLQTEFTTDVERLRQIEEALLTGYAWVDRAAGRVRVPIERAMALVAEGGLPASSSAVDAAPATSGERVPSAKEEADATP
ncbi:MAG: hypothetical protein ACRD2Z_08635 [Thermoanaerobaculia bacterium]